MWLSGFVRPLVQWIIVPVSTLGLASCSSTIGPNPSPGAHNIQNVFIIMMENHNWTGDGTSSIQNNPDTPYINLTLLPASAHASNYNNPPHIHPSLPNYLWLEAGTNFGILSDGSVAADSQSTTQHLVSLLNNAGISWKSYDESTDGKSCPFVGQWHTPFVFFDDVTNNMDPTSAYCIAHVRPLSELDTDLAAGTAARYNFIVPDACHSMHTVCNRKNRIAEGDTWLSQQVPSILNSSAYKNGGALFILWDEASKGDGPIPLLILSPFAKGGGYTNSTYYNHGSTLRTMEEIFGVQPFLGNAAQETDLGDFFTAFP